MVKPALSFRICACPRKFVAVIVCRFVGGHVKTACASDYVAILKTVMVNPSAHNLAQLNVAAMKESTDSPAMADFMASLDRINALAESAPGFVWRLVGDPPENPFGPTMLVNLSVWRDVGSLSDFVYRSGHVEIMRRRREWFASQAEASMVLWWVPAGHIPTVREAAARLELLRQRGPTAEAFSFASRHGPPDLATQVDEPVHLCDP
jgi:hypothetical protein